jgi:chloramphenicol-sensitive protein RarD
MNRSNADKATTGRGYTAAISAFTIWGFFPLYLIGLVHVSAMQITAHRITWSLLFVIGWLAVTRDLSKLRDAMSRRDVLLRLALSAFCICVNWIGFAWAVNHDRVLDVSLAYYIGPLINVLLGVFVLSERLDRVQWTAVAFAAAGVTHLGIVAGHAPWLALMVGASFAFYGLIRKTVAVAALPGLAVETVLLTPFALGYLAWCEMSGIGAMGHMNALVDVLLLASGVVTAVPLVLFAYGARHIPLSTIGIIQFIGPSLQLVCGLVVFGEPFPAARALGFVLIWIGLLIYAVNGWRNQRRLAPQASTTNF